MVKNVTMKIVVPIVLCILATIGYVLTFFLLTRVSAVGSYTLITAALAISLYLINKRIDASKSPKIAETAIAGIVTLASSNPVLSLIVRKNPSISAYFGLTVDGAPPNSIEFGILLLIGVAIFAIVIVVWISRGDETLTGRSRGDVDRDIGEFGFHDKLVRIAEVMKTRLTKIDDELNWTDHSFSPLDAEIERFTTSGGRPRRITDLVSSIRRERGRKAFLVLGDPGSGKSVALRHVTRLMLEEVPSTHVLPIYINLKEWSGSSRLQSKERVDLFSFIRENIMRHANDLVIDFCEKYLKKMLECGRLYILFDSF